MRLSRIPKFTSAQLHRLNIRLAHSLAKEHTSHTAALTHVFTLTDRMQNRSFYRVIFSIGNPTISVLQKGHDTSEHPRPESMVLSQEYD